MKRAKVDEPGHDAGQPPYFYLPASWSVGAIVASVLIVLGLHATPIQVVPSFMDKGLWPASWDGWFEKALIFVLTLFLMVKQTDYYYGWLNSSSKSGLFKALGAANTWEVIADFALGLCGVAMIVVAGLWPYLWLPMFAVYCLLGWSRCRLTLQRSRTARRQRHEGHRSAFAAVFSLDPFDRDFIKLANSIDGNHKAPGRGEVSKKAVLVGWIWSFCTYGLVSAISCIYLIAYGRMPVRLVSAADTFLVAAILFAFIRLTSGYSQRFGEKNIARFTE